MVMNIGVDVRLLSRQLTGIGYYSLEMCQALAKHSDVSLHLYSPDLIRVDLPNALNIRIKTNRWKNPFLRHYWSLRSLPTWIKSDDVDVFWGPAHRLPMRLPHHIARVVTIHDLTWKCAPESMRTTTRLLDQYYMPKALSVADAVVADSQATADTLMQVCQLPPEKITVIGLGVRIKSAKNSEPLSFAPLKKPFFLFVGTLEPRKNLARLLQAYARLSDACKNKASLIIAGGKGWGDVETDIKNTIQQLNLQAYVHCLGYVNEATLEALYENCLFLAMPSLYEGFGLPIVEANSHGKPVLTSKTSSMPEVAGKAGYFVDPFSIESIQQALENLIVNEPLRSQLALHAKENAKRFEWETSATKLMQVFKKAISQKRALYT